MNWDDARLFLAVARAGQISSAARRLGITQGTLSRRIHALESRLGSKLMIRRSRGSELTEAGERLRLSLERVESELMQATGALTIADEAISGEVRIGAPDGFGVAFLAPRLARLSELHPALSVQLVPVTQSFSLSAREADMAILIERPQKGALVACKLADYSLSLYASPRYLERHGIPATLDDLKAHRLVGYVEDLASSPALAYAREIWPQWQAQVQISSALGQIEAVRAGAGIGVLHDYLVPADSLQPILPHHKARRSYWLAYHESLKGIARVEKVAGFIAEAVRSERSLFDQPDRN